MVSGVVWKSPWPNPESPVVHISQLSAGFQGFLRFGSGHEIWSRKWVGQQAVSSIGERACASKLASQPTHHARGTTRRHGEGERAGGCARTRSQRPRACVLRVGLPWGAVGGWSGVETGAGEESRRLWVGGGGSRVCLAGLSAACFGAEAKPVPAPTSPVTPRRNQNPAPGIYASGERQSGSAFTESLLFGAVLFCSSPARVFSLDEVSLPTK